MKNFKVRSQKDLLKKMKLIFRETMEASDLMVIDGGGAGAHHERTHNPISPADVVTIVEEISPILKQLQGDKISLSELSQDQREKLEVYEQIAKHQTSTCCTKVIDESTGTFGWGENKKIGNQRFLNGGEPSAIENADSPFSYRAFYKNESIEGANEEMIETNVLNVELEDPLMVQALEEWIHNGRRIPGLLSDVCGAIRVSEGIGPKRKRGVIIPITTADKLNKPSLRSHKNFDVTSLFHTLNQHDFEVDGHREFNIPEHLVHHLDKDRGRAILEAKNLVHAKVDEVVKDGTVHHTIRIHHKSTFAKAA